MAHPDIQKFADMLYEAERTRVPIEPLTDMAPSLTADDAYAIQLANVDRYVKEGRIVSGKKIGLTSEGIQKQLGVHEPDYGHLYAHWDCSDGVVRSDELIVPNIECEVAFILKEDLTGGSVTAEDVRKVTDYVCASFEIVDSRIKDWKIKLQDTVADDGSSCRYVLGKKKVNIYDVDLPKVHLDFYKNGEKIKEGECSAVMGDPVNTVAWLSNKLWSYGVALKKGEVVLSGAITAAPPARKGEHWKADMGELGTVECEFI